MPPWGYVYILLILFLIGYFVSTFTSYESPIPVEDLTAIRLPGYTGLPSGYDAYNLGLILDRGRLVTFARMSNFLRCGQAKPSQSFSHTVVRLFDPDTFEPLTSPQILDEPIKTDGVYNGYEDPRPFWWNAEGGGGRSMYLVRTTYVSRPSHRDRVLPQMLLTKLDEHYQPVESTLLQYQDDKPQKNWGPLPIGNDLYFIYSVYPVHKLLHYNRAMTTIETPSPSILQGYQGGRPITYLPDRDEYLGICHRCFRTNYMFRLYTFSAKPPFAISGVSPNEYDFSNHIPERMFGYPHHAIQVGDEIVFSVNTSDCGINYLIRAKLKDILKLVKE